MKKLLVMTAILATSACTVAKNDPLAFKAEGQTQELTLLDGRVVRYTAYLNIPYVSNPEDPNFQVLNYFVPEGATSRSAILLRTYVGGYMAASAKTPSATDATGRALVEGLCVCIPASRGNNSEVDGRFTGKAPRGLLDLKAAIRYLRHNDKRMPGSAERIITDGTSAGGAMSALLGATANHPDYEPLLKAMGAARARDDVFASVCYCPITDLDHADMAYEWLYLHQRPDTEASRPIARQFDEYINSLHLRNPKTGESLTADNYMDYLKSWLLASAQRFTDEGGVIDDSLGFQRYLYFPQTPGHRPGGPRLIRAKARESETLSDVDMDNYLHYVASRQALKERPAFDRLDSPECSLFGDAEGNPAHFTGDGLSDELRQRVRMMNPMPYISDPRATTAPHWYIRHGAIDRDTSFPIPVNLATKLMNEGRDVNFALPWNRRHEGDYNLDDLFRWLRSIL